ncbi:MAG TPA: 2-phospho-L-lactate transferase [Candidatus Dormibacteraeota bacterium]|nr:2-phospho-L-lactate transferase [Candidatus Dormibacteraeota bacterium]
MGQSNAGFGDAPAAGASPKGLRIVVLAGGVGAARFLQGLVMAVPDAEITVIGNTADDFTVHGLHVSPDLDSVLYTLGGLGDEERGWGMREESWNVLDRLRSLGEDSWFQLGDRDLATHLFRTVRLRRGRLLSEVTAELAERLALPVRLLPMTDQTVTTRIHTRDGRDLHLQEYLVREQCQPQIKSFEFRGAERARPGPGTLGALRDADLVLVAPSNPVISIGPILAVPGMREEVLAAPQVVGITPIVGGRAIKGPAVPMLEALGLDPSPLGIANYYGSLLQLLVIDQQDEAEAPSVRALGMATHLCDTLMIDSAARQRLAQSVLSASGVGPQIASQ